MLWNYFVFAFDKTVAMQYCSRIESGSVDEIAKDLEDNWQFYVNTQDSADFPTGDINMADETHQGRSRRDNLQSQIDELTGMVKQLLRERSLSNARSTQYYRPRSRSKGPPPPGSNASWCANHRWHGEACRKCLGTTSNGSACSFAEDSKNSC
ncbi:hypothetical protein Ciccas_005510 [Cichlidogyrus casuarinus]|uniref:Uncharacterized protein n=1 Tax=Cichlidogyrus casuarinus TaxID=1844966 RepID=A0ABD2Q8G4_9PLAT